MFAKILKKTELKKNLLISVIGIGAGQIIHLGTTPIISRLYSPEVFGQYALFMSFFGILTALSLMKVELAIMASENSEVGALNYFLKKIGFVVTILTTLATIYLWYIKSEYLIIFIALSIIIFISNRFWTWRAIINKEENFKALSVGKVLENSLNSLIAIGLAFSIIKDFGLYIGKIIGLLLSFLYFKKSSKTKYELKKDEALGVLKKYSNYPKYSFPAELVSHLSQSTSIFLYTYLFSSLEVGLIGLTTRVLSVPANFISVSFFDVFKQKAILDYKEYGSFRTIFKKFFFILLLLALLMITFISLTGPTLFNFVFGSEWTKAGIYAQYLTVLYAIKLVAVPLTFSLEIKNKHYINLIFQSIYLVVGIIIIPVVYFYTRNDVDCIKYYSFTQTSFYILHIFFAFKASGKD